MEIGCELLAEVDWVFEEGFTVADDGGRWTEGSEARCGVVETGVDDEDGGREDKTGGPVMMVRNIV